ncbi:ThuA domain-containing protein [Paenibacillus montanisoli]|uniref:Trehalose utilization protein ThuA n=1 Tax=Paenibacillus montanisoli TaxID=2081970 RepID=A0A328U1D8_9BACL|nr:ThuA domain-containing protein [Paenibacillus montanisoli]RAP75261.1 trehalose utilization protein ThuA [Paenibacillus montanisoli]
MIKVTIWNEFLHEINNPIVASIYPEGIHGAIAAGLNCDQISVRTATLAEPEHGLSEETLNDTDVLIWWGHLAHDLVDDEIVERVYNRVLAGMGLIVLHSGHASKIFRKLLGTPTEQLKWREADEKERIWVIDPSHPIAAGIGEYIELEKEEMYGEHFHIPAPDQLVFVSWFEGGEVFRSGVTYSRGQGKVFYFRPGHESYPTYYNQEILRVIANGVRWAAPSATTAPSYGHSEPLERILVKS